MVFSEKEIFIGIGIFIIIGGLIAFLIIVNTSEENFYNEIKLPSVEGILQRFNGITGNVVNNFESISVEKDYCGDNYCYKDINGNWEDCNNCPVDCGTCKEVELCGNRICDYGECITCSRDCSLLECENNVCEPKKGENCLDTPNDCKCNIGYVCNSQKKNCVYSDQKNDIINDKSQINSESPDANYPIIFIHGHSFQIKEVAGDSISSFKQIEDVFDNGGYFFRGNLVFPSSDINAFKDEFSNKGKPVTFRTTYYLGVLNKDNLYAIEDNQDSIEVYGSRLSNVINIVLKTTGKNKVNIVTHSMGGLVARDYIKNGGDKYVNKLIMVGTPNHGVYGQVADNCENLLGFIPNGAAIECREMKAGSDFLKKLNSGDETPGKVKYYTIAGSGCFDSSIDGDGISRVSSVQLEGANNVVIKKKYNNECTSITDRDFHSDLLNPELYPETIDYIKQFLKE